MVSAILVVCSWCVFLCMCLFLWCLLCLTVFLSYLLNAFAICVGEVNVLCLKVFLFFLLCWVFVG